MKSHARPPAPTPPHEPATPTQSEDADAACEPHEYFSAPCLAHELADDGTLMEGDGNVSAAALPDADDKPSR